MKNILYYTRLRNIKSYIDVNMIVQYRMYMYSAILHLLHALYGFIVLIYNTCIFCTKFFSKNDLESSCIELKNLKKRPHHLVIMLGNEKPVYKDLASIVLWSTVAGIPVISFYDHNGILKNTKERLYEELDACNTKYEVGPKKNGHKNGTTHSPIRINILSMADGQNSLAEVTKTCLMNNVKDSEIEVEYVDEELRKRFDQVPDPDLALYCGPICSTYGILPWQIRLTEFVDITSHKGIHLNQFIVALQRYERSEQRFGK